MKKIVIEHIARVEGNGGVTATIDGNVVTDVKFTVNEGPRLVERLTLGKTPEEDVNLVPRICAICTLSHKYAAIRAMEKALNVKVGPKVKLLRELMHLGEMVESHALHVFYLALPDYVGFPNAIAMASKFPLEVKIALEMKQFGNHIMKTTSGRYIHGENPVIGGFGKFPSRDELVWIKSRAIQFMPFVMKTVKLFAELPYPDIPESETLYACCNPPDKKYGIVGDEIILSTGDIIDVQDYKRLANEFVVPHSFCKRSQYKGKPYSVGALARVNCLGERLEGEARKMYKTYFNARWTKNPLFNNAAQALELAYSFERIPEVIEEALMLPDESIIPYGQKDGKGVGAVEAPRGTLFHAYEVTKGLVSHADIITPTAQNAEDIERYCYITAQKLLESGQEEKIKDRMDLVIRSFDPCISCSVHTVQVRRAPQEDWKTKIAKIKTDVSPVIVGIGSAGHSDDGAGLELARRLRSQGVKDVWIEDETLEKTADWEMDERRPLLFVDAVDFGERPGKITIIPLQHAAWNAVLSHRLLPLVTHRISFDQLKNSYILGIQPASLEDGEQMSEPVLLAMEQILERLKN
ncbi:hydrogenase maturation protease [bacterium]|nr:MAG: hydrogenase maturation protease [bacterium]